MQVENLLKPETDTSGYLV